jgi:dTDP-4-amino-4,6-dideoxygalactose transaminase
MSFDSISRFEAELAEFTGAPLAIMTDCCTHAIELCLRWDQVKYCTFTAFTYLSIPMTMHKLNIPYAHESGEQTWIGEYHFGNTRIWDSARRMEKQMYRAGQMQCLSFGHGKPLTAGGGGAILLDDPVAHAAICAMRYDGRDLQVSPWQAQGQFRVGYHYRPTIEQAVQASAALTALAANPPVPKFHQYPDLRTITIVP